MVVVVIGKQRFKCGFAKTAGNGYFGLTLQGVLDIWTRCWGISVSIFQGAFVGCYKTGTNYNIKSLIIVTV